MGEQMRNAILPGGYIYLYRVYTVYKHHVTLYLATCLHPELPAKILPLSSFYEPTLPDKLMLQYMDIKIIHSLEKTSWCGWPHHNSKFNPGRGGIPYPQSQLAIGLMQVSSERNLGYLLNINILPSYIWVVLSQYKDPPKNQSGQSWNVIKVVFFYCSGGLRLLGMCFDRSRVDGAGGCDFAPTNSVLKLSKPNSPRGEEVNNVRFYTWRIFLIKGF